MGLAHINTHQKSRVEHRTTQKGQDHRRGRVLRATSTALLSAQGSLCSFPQHKRPQALHSEFKAALSSARAVEPSPSLGGHLRAGSASGAAELDGADVGEGEEGSALARFGRACDPWVRGLEAPGEHGAASVALVARRVRAA